MTPAELAVNHSISFECKKDALQQRQSGDWKISFTVQGLDMDERITRAPMGTRFVAVLVAINDDELPIALAEKEKAKSAVTAPELQPDQTDKPRSAGAKRDWRDVPPSQQAGIRINEPTFAAYLREEHSDDWHETQDADACLKLICGIASKRDLISKGKARTLWFQIDSAYQAWLAKERVGA